MKKVEIIGALLGDVALPLVGFLFWDWGFYFIVLFFLFDIVFRSFFIGKRITLLPSMDIGGAFVVKSIALVIIEVFLLHVLIYFSLSPFDFFTELWGFLSYRELGIAQGLVLLPLLVLNEVLRIRNEKKLNTSQNLRFELLKNNQYAQFFRILLWLLFIAFSLLFSFQENLLVSLFILTLCIQPFWIYRNIQ